MEATAQTGQSEDSGTERIQLLLLSLSFSLSPLFSQSEGRHFGQLYDPFTCNNELLLFLHFAFI